jgi:predicted dehydrogenase
MTRGAVIGGAVNDVFRPQEEVLSRSILFKRPQGATMPHDETRREFLRDIAGLYTAGIGLGLAGCAGGATSRSGQGAKAAAAVSAPLRAEAIDRVRVGLIGSGDRGTQHLRLLCILDHVDVKAIADPYPPAAKRGRKICTEAGLAPPGLYTQGDHDYRRMLEREDLDAVIIATPWRWHCPHAVHAMQAGKHAFVEVPMAVSIDELWQMVETSESTGRHCMMMENVNYGRDEMMALNMCRRGLLGDLLHGEAAYIHDLRYQMKDVEHGTGSWRTAYYEKHNGNLYPTHGLGPIAQYMNIDRTEDRFSTMTSVSSLALGRDEYARENFPPDHPRRRVKYRCGDINTSIIRTELGRTIMVQWDTATPRPYTRHNLIQGTHGVFAGFPTRLAIEGRGSYHEWTQGEAMQEVYQEFEHPLWKRLHSGAVEAGGHGGMDYVMLYRIVECLRSGQPLDQNVYEGASWSAVRPLSEKSVNASGNPVPFPDFTRGRWRQTEPLSIVT